MTVGLKLDKPPAAIIAGEILHGRIYLSVSEEQHASSVRLKVVGRECATVHHTTSEQSSSASEGDGRGGSYNTIDHFEKSTHDIWNVDHPVKAFQTGLFPEGNTNFLSL